MSNGQRATFWSASISSSATVCRAATSLQPAAASHQPADTEHPAQLEQSQTIVMGPFTDFTLSDLLKFGKNNSFTLDAMFGTN